MSEGKSDDKGKKAHHRRGAHSRELRIIGGAWRGRRLRFPDLEEIRPTPDRVRETLFNWLGPKVIDARCLDLFAGSGALGLEAISRGAGRVVFVERDAIAARELRKHIEAWGATNAHVQQQDALRFLSGTAESFDIVFLDPPFAANVLESTAQRLEVDGWLAPNALIYVELPAREGLPTVPTSWRAHRTKAAGEVGYHLFERIEGRQE
jgi:16S rRNA (guanine966-N2)-methyltransferase